MTPNPHLDLWLIPLFQPFFFDLEIYFFHSLARAHNFDTSQILVEVFQHVAGCVQNFLQPFVVRNMLVQIGEKDSQVET